MMDEQKEMNHMRELVELNEWQDCLWHAMTFPSRVSCGWLSSNEPHVS